ncbi:DUF1349 domain-containing protein [Streptomyces sp. CC210A]|uniref:DUF1349 domain-containing protein n=1 Tax=Streptomyces sp. CC210A TaxID=2898184 RepID=UPI001F468716|nr:DUF1349 domain-containing protein [Streptomyces sp. CC210A]
MTGTGTAAGRAAGDAARTLGFDDPAWRFDGPGTTPVRSTAELAVRAPRGADLFSMPGAYEASGVPLLSRAVTGDHTVWARVAVDGAAFGDAGGIAVHGTDGWFKACVERTRTGAWAVVTVVSRPVSDEALGPALSGPHADLLVTREGPRHAVFCRERADEDWRFVRTFTGVAAAREPDVRLGLFSQAPFSDACTATFTAPVHAPCALPDRR